MKKLNEVLHDSTDLQPDTLIEKINRNAEKESSYPDIVDMTSSRNLSRRLAAGFRTLRD